MAPSVTVLPRIEELGHGPELLPCGVHSNPPGSKGISGESLRAKLGNGGLGRLTSKGIK